MTKITHEHVIPSTECCNAVGDYAILINCEYMVAQMYSTLNTLQLGAIKNNCSVVVNTFSPDFIGDSRVRPSAYPKPPV